MKYKTVDGVVVKNVIKRSTFIATVKRVSSMSEVESLLRGIKAQYKDANHNPYAYRLVSGESHYSDDGEPSGSAGLPIFNAIRHFDVYNVCVVVTRYFGGIKLGIPGLIEAYGKTAEFAISSAKIVEEKTMKTFEITFPYKSFNYVNYVLNKVQAEIIKREFNEIGLVIAKVDEDMFDDFTNLLKKEGSISFKILSF
ncbi:IMPACT family protein [Caldisericum exile]|uniref:Impact N-terminal domain-containing protein n=1 Tax=Caldisericum exile (strain DSM 21853 / NBRC 104410 / AZM16c01) TaxID=511051 RepID=A0A7U6GE57_CALEA|nr:YigZ family protein [Caldisericum exile]BAL80729.1 hypothetical protein CSE_06030 [Caldisericum exile AZM16c01]